MDVNAQNQPQQTGSSVDPAGNNQRPDNRARPPAGGRPQRLRPRRATNRNNLRSREGFFMHYLFITLSIRYATYFKPTARRLIEFFTLIKAIMMLLLLIYIHSTFVRETGNCLDHVDDIWPRSGILKVQVETNTSLPPYHFYFVKKNVEEWAASFQAYPHQAIFKYSAQLGKDGLPQFTRSDNVTRLFPPQTPNDVVRRAHQVLGIPSKEICPAFNTSSQIKKRAQKLMLERFKDVTPEIEFLHIQEKEEIPQWIMVDPSVSDTVAELKMLQMQEVSGFNVGPQPVRAYYAIEYSMEFGYLRLSALTRHKLGIPVLVVTLDPTKDKCFGDGVKRWMLDTFFGYDDLVMGSIKHLAEKDNKQGGGYLRNLVTGEHYKFITLWVSHASYLLAFAVMLIFTLVVTMLLRYSYHQIFVFMVELLHILDTDATPVFPAAPMLTIILALVGTEEIMTEFFHDSTLAFYVILSIWVADQFDAICMHTVVSRRHWVRFFFLYHFAFYAYHYRFNGQFSELALFTSWLFIQHSMFYFFHHYELPAIQRQIRLRRVLLQTNVQTTTTTAPGSQGGSGDPPGGDSGPETAEGNGNAGRAPMNSEPPATAPDPGPAPDASSQPLGTSQPDSQGTVECVSERECGDVHGQYDHCFLGGHGIQLDDGLGEEVKQIEEPRKMQKATSEVTVVITTADITTLEEDSEREKAEIWDDDLKLVFENAQVQTIEADLGHNSVGFFKYCNLIIVLFFAVATLILLFAFVVILLNQGRMGARWGVQDFHDVAKIVR